MKSKPGDKNQLKYVNSTELFNKNTLNKNKAGIQERVKMLLKDFRTTCKV